MPYCVCRLGTTLNMYDSCLSPPARREVQNASLTSRPWPSSKVPYILPSSACSKSFVSHSYENCRGLPTFFPFWHSPVVTHHRHWPRIAGSLSSPFFSCTSALFAATEHSQTLFHQSFAHSFPLNGGWGYVRSSSERAKGSLSRTWQCPLPPLCFQSLPTIKLSNPRLLKTIQNARGVPRF